MTEYRTVDLKPEDMPTTTFLRRLNRLEKDGIAKRVIRHGGDGGSVSRVLSELGPGELAAKILAVSDRRVSRATERIVCRSCGRGIPPTLRYQRESYPEWLRRSEP